MKVLQCTPITAAAYVAPRILSLLAGADLAAAQQPTQAQGSAIRAACRSDYRSHCATVPTGGPEALQCLQKNVASLSPPCQQAVNAVGGGAPAASPATAAPATPVTATPAAPAAPAAPATPVTATPAAPAASPPSAAPATAVTATPAAPATPAATKQPSKTQAGKPTGSAVAAPAASAPPVATPAPPPVVRVVTPREVLVLLRTACADDFRTYCPGVGLGGGRVIGCLEAKAASLSPNCQSALAALGR